MFCAIKKHQNVRSQKSERQVRVGHCVFPCIVLTPSEP